MAVLLSSELSPADRAAAVAAVRESIRLNPGWEDWEFRELLTSAELSAGVSLSAAERVSVRYS